MSSSLTSASSSIFCRLPPCRRAHLGPQLGLGGFDEGEDPRREQRPLHIPFGVGAGQPAALLEQQVFDLELEGAFGGLAGHGQLFQIVPSISNARYFSHLAMPSRSGNSCLSNTPY
jgi:hypothetical protein